MPLEERLELSIDDALSRVDQIGTALDQAAESFKVNLADALDVLKAPQAVEVTADASAVTTDVTTAVQSADTTVTPDAITTDITSQIDEAVKSADTTTGPIQADAADVTSGIDDAIAAADTTVTVEADTSQAQDALAGLGDSGTEAGKGLSDAASGASGATEGIALVGPAAGLAAGELGGLTEVAGKLGPEAAGAAAGVGALVAVGKDLFDAALEQQTAIERLNRTFGDQAHAVEQIHMGGLNTDLEHLSLLTGSNVDGLRNFAASFGQLGIDSGHAKEQVAQTADQIIVLANRAAVLNPNLGSADEIVQRLSTSLARGGRFLSAYGISLTSAEINARALIDTGKQSAAELTVFEKATAGAEIATERLGNKLGKDITSGAQSDAIQVRRLGVELEEAKKKAGAALVQPVTESMTALVPVLVDTIRLLGEGLTGALRAVEPELKAVGSLASFLGSSGSSGFGIFGAAVKNLIGQLNPLHQIGQLVSLTQGHFSDFAHGLPAIGVAFDVFDKGKTQAEKMADSTKKLAEEQNQQAHASLISAVAAGTLSRETEVAAIKQHTAKDGTVDWVGVLDQLQNTMVTTASKSDQYSEAVANQAKATKEAADGQQDLANIQLNGLVASGQLTKSQLDQLTTLNLTKQGTVDYVAALKSISPAQAAVAADTAIIAGGLSTVHTNMQLARDEAALYKEQFADLVQPTLEADSAQLKFQTTIESITSKFSIAKTQADAYKVGIEQSVDPVLAAEEGNLKLFDAIDATNKALADNKGATDEKTKAGRDDQQAVLDLVKAYDTSIDAQIRSGEAVNVVQRSRQEELDKLRALEHQYPGLKGRIEEYITALGSANNQTEIANRVTEDHRAKLQDVIGAGEKWIETLIATGASEGEITTARQQEIDKLNALKAQYPELGGVIDGYIAKLQGIPPSKDTLVNLPNTIQNEVDLSNIHDAIERLKEKNIPVTVENVQQALNDAASVKGGVDAIKNDVPINLHTEGIGATTTDLGSVSQQLAYIFGLSGKPVTIPVNIQVQGNTTLIPGNNVGTGRMAGGPIWPGVWTVGEAGPETLVVDSQGGGIVIPNAAPQTAGAPAQAIDYTLLGQAVAKALTAQRPVIVNEVANDPLATAEAVGIRLGQEAQR